MTMKFNSVAERQHGLGRTDSTRIHDLDSQRLRILRCTAQAMASSPGGLRFKAGTQPWLEGVPGGRVASALMAVPRGCAAAA